MHEFADGDANIAENHTHVVARSLAPTVSPYCNANVWLAPDSYVFHLGRDDWLHAVNSNLLGFADRFLFASAYPLNALKPQLERFRGLGWKEELLPKLFWRNAAGALRLRERSAFAESAEWAGRLGA